MTLEELTAYLGCPLSGERPDLRIDGDHLVCSRGGCRFPVVNGIPHLLVESAVRVGVCSAEDCLSHESVEKETE